MISMAELLKGKNFEDQTPEVQENLNILLERVNKIRSSYGKPMSPTSGLRTMSDHLRIYQEKAAKAGVPFDESKVPMKSRHLYGEAVDISDPNKELQQWCIENEALLEEFELWCEDFAHTLNWVHFQTKPPKSGNRFFIP